MVSPSGVMVCSLPPGSPCEQILSVQKSMKEWNEVLESHTGFVLLCTAICVWVWGVWGVDVGCVGCECGVWVVDMGCVGYEVCGMGYCRKAVEVLCHPYNLTYFYSGRWMAMRFTSLLTT